MSGRKNKTLQQKMGPKPNKGPYPKSKNFIIAKDRAPLRKSPRLARLEVTDPNYSLFATKLNAHSDSTVGKDNVGNEQTPTTSPQSGNHRRDRSNLSDMESLTTRIPPLLETVGQTQPIERTCSEEEAPHNRSIMSTNATTSEGLGGQRTTTCSNRMRELSCSNSSDIDNEDNNDNNDNDDRDSTTSNQTAERFVYTDPPKAVKVIPAFTGENELWTVWFGRFKAISSQWTDNEKLSAMLPLLQGTAGTYVFDTLPAHTRLALEYYKEPESVHEALEKVIAYEDATKEMPTKATIRQTKADEMSSEDAMEAGTAN